MENIKLFCIPYAGGLAISYLSWKKHIDSKIELRAVELAGRGRRSNEKLFEKIEEAVEDVFLKIKNEIKTSPYAFFGHSMGTIFVYELVKKIRRNHLPEPEKIFFSGRTPPFINYKKKRHLLSDNLLLQELVEFGGINHDLLVNEEFITNFLPVIRADFKMVEMYEYIHDGFKLDCDITVLNGKYDKNVNQDDLIRWKDCTSKKCTFYEFDGAHFFINDFKERISTIINKTLLN